MTSKEAIKCIKSFLPDENCYSCSSCMYYTESDCFGYGDKCYLKQAFNFLNKENPTLSDCIKEWENRGFVYENNDKRIYFANEKENILIYIQKELKDVTISVCHYNYAQTISFDLHNLIHKTLKALEEMKDDKN